MTLQDSRQKFDVVIYSVRMELNPKALREQGFQKGQNNGDYHNQNQSR